MLDIHQVDEINVVSLKEGDRLNAPIAEAIREELTELFSQPKTNVIFKLEGIAFIDSTGFSVFLSALKAANNNYGQFKICNVSPELMQLFNLLQLHNVFEIYDELQACLDSFNC
ncbi:MAG: anti-anti-sigma factor [Bacteroidetes bacterium]|nr:MAG: anti-anti-sigma factor [Bacteroidota bacterium]